MNKQVITHAHINGLQVTLTNDKGQEQARKFILPRQVHFLVDKLKQQNVSIDGLETLPDINDF